MGKNTNKKRKRASHALLDAAKAFHSASAAATVPTSKESSSVSSSPLIGETNGRPHTTNVSNTTPVLLGIGGNNSNNTSSTLDHGGGTVEGDHTNDNSDTISDSDLAIAVLTIERLVANPSIFHSKQCKGLRRSLHPLVLEQLQSYDRGIDYRHRVTQALARHQWTDAIASLQACRDYHQYPKQGTIQRWVRDCTLAPSGPCHVRLLQSILQVSYHPNENENDATAAVEEEDGVDHDNDDDVDPNNNNNSSSNTNYSNKHDPGQALVDHLTKHHSTIAESMTVLEGWKWWEENNSVTGKGIVDLRGKDDDDDDHEIDNDNPTTPPRVTLQSKVVYQEIGIDRTPPNHWDLILHTTQPGCIRWSTIPRLTAYYPIPFLQTEQSQSSARLLAHVLTPTECNQFIDATTQLGYRLDHPLSLDTPTGIDSCEWMVDHSIANILFTRVQSYLPPTLTIPGKRGGGGGDGKLPPHQQNHDRVVHLHGINPRWRCFRYGQDCVYRPHLDGSWPQCFVDEEGYYQCPKQSAIKSYLTFLIYLNENFEGGETRFYLPHGTIQGVVPQTGSVLVFPQGNVTSLIHEGSQVTRGTKYVIRTDVLYRST
jgi:hypothetical protein